jgi:nitroreductase
MEFDEAVRSRRSIKTYDSDVAVDDATLKRLFELVTQSPSSFNLQHWRFVVIRDVDRRKELMAASWGQPHVGAAPAVVVVAGKLRAHEDAARANGHAPQEVLDSLVPVIERSYANNEQFQRDEAIRSGSLASMTLMLAARTLGLVTCPMIGFQPAEVARIAGLDEGHIPVMLITLGKQGGGDIFPTSRFPLEEVVRLERLDGAGLS